MGTYVGSLPSATPFRWAATAVGATAGPVGAGCAAWAGGVVGLAAATAVGGGAGGAVGAGALGPAVGAQACSKAMPLTARPAAVSRTKRLRVYVMVAIASPVRGPRAPLSVSTRNVT